MTAPRRRVLRPPRVTVAEEVRWQRQLAKWHSELEKQQESLQRWMGKLKRAFHAVEKQQVLVARLERRIRQLQAS